MMVSQSACWHVVVAGGLLLCACGCETPDSSDKPPGPWAAHHLTINRHSSTPLSESRADEILGAMTEVIQTRDGADDVACGVLFVRDGAVMVFEQGNGMINSEADFEAVQDLPGRVKVVNQINWCSGLAPNIIGCAPFYGDSMIVVRHAPNLEGILWLHEFGHLEGLDHRDDFNAVMNATVGSNRRRILAWECDAFDYGSVITNPPPETP